MITKDIGPLGGGEDFIHHLESVGIKTEESNTEDFAIIVNMHASVINSYNTEFS